MSLVLCLVLADSALPVGAADPPAARFFDLPPGPASSSLKQFIAQSGVQLLYVPEEVSEVVTNAVKGRFTAGEAVKRLLANTGLVAVETKNGAIAVNRVPVPNGPRVARFE
jgi:iron complex outermembrane receptor protein